MNNAQQSQKKPKPTVVIVPECRLAFPSLFKPKPRQRGEQDQSKWTFQAVLLLPPTLDLSPFVSAMKAAMLDKFGKLISLPATKNPIRDCAEKNQTAGYI